MSDQNAAQSISPTVSVVVAAYNAAGHIKPAIESALSQSGISLELLVIDDASSDGTVAVVEELAEQDDRITLLQNPMNTGPGGARNRGFEQASGDWIAVLDSDDRFEPGRLKTMVAAAHANGADIVIDDFSQVDDAGNLLEPAALVKRRKPGIVDLESWIGLNAFTQAEVSFGYAKPLFSKSFLQDNDLRYNEKLRNGEDYHLILQALIAGAKVYFTGQTGYCYTRRENSISGRAKGEHMVALMKADEAIARMQSPFFTNGVREKLRERRTNLRRLMTTEDVLGALKSRNVISATSHLLKNPGAFGRVLGHLGEAIQKRTRRHQ